MNHIVDIKNAMNNWNGGAIYYPNGDIVYTNKKHEVHRIDGPAHIYQSYTGAANMKHSWFVNNKRVYNWEEFQKASKISNEELLLLILQYGEIT